MGVMEKFRASTSYILWILILSFGLLWGIAQTNFFSNIKNGSHTLGSVDGKTISLQAYNNRVEYYMQNYQNQTGNSGGEDMRSYYENQAWNDIVMDQILQDKMKELGITVTNNELVNMVTGPNPDPMIVRQFQKKDGSLDRVALEAAIKAPENTKAWIAIEHQLREKRRREKLSDIVQSALEVSQRSIAQEYLRENSTVSFDYVKFPYADIPDSTVSVSDAQMRQYYDDHQDQFKQKKNWRFQYVTFSKAPTKEDTLRDIKQMKDLRSDFADAKDDSLFLVQNLSQTPYSNSYIKKSEIKKSLQVVFSLKKGEVSNVIQDGGTLHLVKNLGEKTIKGEPAAKFADLSVDITADPIETVDKMAQKADDFSYYAQDGGFEQEVQKEHLQVHSGFATDGNPFIAGIGQSNQLLDYLKGAEAGKVSKSIELPDYFVVLDVQKITPAGVQPFEDVKNQIEPIVRNTNRRDELAKQVAQSLAEHPMLPDLAKATGKKMGKTENISFSANVIPDLGREPEVVGAAFGLPKDKVSAPIKGNSGVFVIKVDQRSMADTTKIPAPAIAKIRGQLQQEKTSMFGQIWIQELKKNANIVDNRSRVLRED